jgi:glycosyltransferase involved in cell wall biosynthesis
MKIALVSTQRTAVPPPRSGSVELIVGLLAAELARRGHEVTVFAPGGSAVAGRVVSLLPAGYHEDPEVWDWELAEFMQLGLVYERAAEFDVIHSHAYCYALAFTGLVRTPTVHTFHICPTPDFVRYCGMHPEGRYVVLSEFQRRFLDGIQVEAIVPNGIETRSFPWSDRTGGYLAFLGDLREDKGPLAAVALSQESGIPLRLAGRETPWSRGVLARLIDGRHIEYVGELDHDGKAELLAGALALVFLSPGHEACPLVLLESMACGTPVLALNRGPVPELVTEGVTGFYADDLRELFERAGDVETLDRGAIRRSAVERFDVARMTDDYLDLFARACETRA